MLPDVIVTLSHLNNHLSPCSHYHIIDYAPRAVLCNSLAYFYNWTFVPHAPFHPLLPSPYVVFLSSLIMPFTGCHGSQEEIPGKVYGRTDCPSA